MGCRMTKKSKKKVTEDHESATTDVCPPHLDQLKRKDLQKLCKKLDLKAIGKNVELIERIRGYYNQHEMREVNHGQTNESAIQELSTSNSDEVDLAASKEQCVHETDINVNVSSSKDSSNICTSPQCSVESNADGNSSPKKPLSNSSSPKDWDWVARWCVVDGVLKQDAKERWVLLQLVGGRTLITDSKTKERSDFVLEPSVLPTPETCEDNYICGDCVRKNKEQLSGWMGIKKPKLCETPKSSLGKENCSENLLRQSFKRKREEVISPRSLADFIDISDSPMKVRRLDSRPSCSPASPQVRRDRGEDFQLPKNLLKPWRPKKSKNTPPKEDPDFAQKVEKIITDLSPEEQHNLVFGRKKNSVVHSPPNTKKI